MKYYAVIDTNVLVSAMLKWNSVPGNVMELAFDGPIIPVYNSDIMKEYREVRKCLKGWRSVNQQINCYTNYIIV